MSGTFADATSLQKVQTPVGPPELLPAAHAQRTSALPPIAAISRLNAHARAGGAWNTAARAIYAYKELAALVLAVEGTATLRFVTWQGKCTRCTNGRYSHWEWTDGYTVRCRDCRGTGVRTLRFTETHLPGGVIWHHPWEGRSGSGRSLARAVLGLDFVDCDQRPAYISQGPYIYVTGSGQSIEWRPVGDWQPHLPAARLELPELVQLLNQVEDWVEDPGDWPVPAHTRSEARRHLWRQPKRTSWSEDDYEPTYGYQLDLGHVPGGCFVCGSDDLQTYAYGRSTSLLHWSLPVCKRHSEGPEKAAHPKDPPPAEMITPDIRRWLDRHERIAP